jgi:hypothetical protein
MEKCVLDGPHSRNGEEEEEETCIIDTFYLVNRTNFVHKFS